MYFLTVALYYKGTGNRDLIGMHQETAALKRAPRKCLPYFNDFFPSNFPLKQGSSISLQSAEALALAPSASLSHLQQLFHAAWLNQHSGPAAGQALEPSTCRQQKLKSGARAESQISHTSNPGPQRCSKEWRISRCIEHEWSLISRTKSVLIKGIQSKDNTRGRIWDEGLCFTTH